MGRLEWMLPLLKARRCFWIWKWGRDWASEFFHALDSHEMLDCGIVKTVVF